MESKIAFFIHFPELVNHYQSTWSALNPARFEIIVGCPTASENEFMHGFARQRNYSTQSLDAVLSNRQRFKVTVSNHPFAAGHQGGLANLWELGDIHVRMMYALGKAQWNFSAWNSQYHIAFCWGRYHEECLSDFKSLRKIQVGYPRLDSFYSEPSSKSLLQEKFRLDPDKRTIVWLPTWRALSSIDDFSPYIKELEKDFNLLIKVHPNTLTEEPEKIAILKAHDLEPIADTYFNNYKLIELADCVFADYGGSAFAAIYLNKPVLLLNKHGAESDELTGSQSLDILLREWLPNISIAQANQLNQILREDSVWQPQDAVYQELRSYLFKETKGKSGEIMAEELMKLVA